MSNAIKWSWSLARSWDTRDVQPLSRITPLESETLLIVNTRFYLLLFNLVFIQSAPGVAPLFLFRLHLLWQAHWARGVGMYSPAQLSLHVQLRRLSSCTKRNWIPQNPTQAVRFNRAFKHSHWPLWVGFCMRLFIANRSTASFPQSAALDKVRYGVAMCGFMFIIILHRKLLSKIANTSSKH